MFINLEFKESYFRVSISCAGIASPPSAWALNQLREVRADWPSHISLRTLDELEIKTDFRRREKQKRTKLGREKIEKKRNRKMWNCVLELQRPPVTDGKIHKPVRQDRIYFL